MLAENYDKHRHKWCYDMTRTLLVSWTRADSARAGQNLETSARVRGLLREPVNSALFANFLLICVGEFFNLFKRVGDRTSSALPPLPHTHTAFSS